MAEEKLKDFISNFHKWKQDEKIMIMDLSTYSEHYKDYIITALYVENDVSSAGVHTWDGVSPSFSFSVMWREENDASLETLLDTSSLEKILEESRSLPRKILSIEKRRLEKMEGLKRIVPFEPFIYPGRKDVVYFSLNVSSVTYNKTFFVECYRIPEDMPDIIYPQIYEDYNDVEIADYNTRKRLENAFYQKLSSLK